MTPGERCDEILRLIDETLSACTAPPRPSRPRQPRKPRSGGQGKPPSPRSGKGSDAQPQATLAATA